MPMASPIAHLTPSALQQAPFPHTLFNPSAVYMAPMGDITPLLVAQAVARNISVASTVPSPLPNLPNSTASLPAQSLLLQQAMMLQMYAANGMLPAFNPMLGMYPMCSVASGPTDAHFSGSGNGVGVYSSATHNATTAMAFLPHPQRRPTGEIGCHWLIHSLSFLSLSPSHPLLWVASSRSAIVNSRLSPCHLIQWRMEAGSNGNPQTLMLCLNWYNEVEERLHCLPSFFRSYPSCPGPHWSFCHRRKWAEIAASACASPCP